MSRITAVFGLGLYLGFVVLALTLTADAADQPTVIVPLALSALLAMAAPLSPLASPSTVTRGYLVAAMAGSAAALCSLPGAVGAALAAGGATAAMSFTGAVHPPAAALAILVGGDGPTELTALAGIWVAVAAGVFVLVLAEPAVSLASRGATLRHCSPMG